MAVIYLNRDNTGDLLRLPETGVGFQLVTALYQGARKQFIVFNAGQALDLSDLPDFTGSESQSLIGLWISATYRNTVPIDVSSPPSEFELLSTRIRVNTTVPTGQTPANIVAPPSSLVKSTTLTTSRRFHRFSPYYPDRRVDPVTGDFSPGTYACPESEVPFVPTGFSAVGRFALPSPLPASHHYVIEAKSRTSVLFGTVPPAFGQAGGGVEALFPAGAENISNPQIAQTRLPDE